ncbi:MAG: class I SAM-dependent methyltransferase [Acidimicrobiia bacterium]|nr:class I SAM-dependent methyltransferase [Acidimicrobiia bacterium]
MAAVPNPFMRRDAARRYAQYRPDYSPYLRSILEESGIQADRALDVAAGTGISTRAVSAVAGEVVALDASASMVAVARPIPNAMWLVASAEELPFRSGAFDLITVGSALHWLDREAFVAEAARVAVAGASLVLHENAFIGQMDDVPEFFDWIHHRYLRGYPAPPRGEKLAPGTDLGPFRFVATMRYEQSVEVGRDTLAGYLTTQSNLQVVMTTPQASNDVLLWLEKELNPFFLDAPTRTVHYAGLALVLRLS